MKRLPGRPRGEDHRGGRGGLPEADGRHVGLDELHRVVDGEEPGDLAAGRVDVDRDVLVGVSLSRWSSCAITMLATTSSIGVPRKMMRSCSSRAKTSLRLGTAGCLLGDVGDVEALRVGSLTALAPLRCCVCVWVDASGFVGRGPSMPRAAEVRSTGSPSSSTTSAWSIRNASALPRAMSERTASMSPSPFEILADLRRLLADAARPAGRSRRRPRRRSTSISSWAITARSARSARTASRAPVSRSLATNSSWSWPVAARYCGMVMPDALLLEPVGEVVEAALHLLVDERRRGSRSSTSAAAASSTFSRTRICACTRA